MSRSIPIALQETLDKPVPTVCLLLTIMGTKSGEVYCRADLDSVVVFDYGDGPKNYLPDTGADVSEVQSSEDLETDTAEVGMIIPNGGAVITPELIASGEFDYATYRIDLVDYTNPTASTLIRSGPIGRVRTAEDLFVAVETRSLSAYYREQGLCSLTSITCRHDFGSPLVDANGRMGCGVDVGPLWVTGEVTAVSAEPDRVFTVTLAAAPAYDLTLGLIEMIDGPNVGRQFEVAEATNTSGNVWALTLNREAPANFAIGQDIRIRPDCPKTKAACIARGNLINMGAEPHIVAGDAGKAAMPGARIGSGMVSEGITDSVAVA